MRSSFPRSPSIEKRISAPPRTLGIRKAATWYSSHISLINPTIRGQRPKPRPAVLLLTDDVQNRVKGEKEGISSSSGWLSPLRHEREIQFS
jgi:hypothetical protein